jgi:hypothetical protein
MFDPIPIAALSPILETLSIPLFGFIVAIMTLEIISQLRPERLAGLGEEMARAEGSGTFADRAPAAHVVDLVRAA